MELDNSQRNPKTTNSFKLIFDPHPLARNRHFQTIVSSMKPHPNPILQQTSKTLILDAGDGVRLQGYYAPQPQSQQVKGLVLLLHGWLGHAHATYILALGERLYQSGYSLFRLNLRDHGHTHHLNPGIFRSDMLTEVVNAAQRVSALDPDRPLHLVGASLGGNFALRIAWQQSQTALFRLGHTIAICPVIDPHATTLALDNSPIYLTYFRRKWRQTFKIKQQLFSDLYNFEAEIKSKSCMAMTERFIKRYSPYPNAQSYFRQYAITPAMLGRVRSPTTIITAADDPVVPVADFYPLRNVSPQVAISIQPYGGHVGFIDIFPYRHWLNQAVLSILKEGTGV